MQRTRCKKSRDTVPLRLRGIILPPPIMAQSKMFFFYKNETVQNSKSKSKKLSFLCTFITETLRHSFVEGNIPWVAERCNCTPPHNKRGNFPITDKKGNQIFLIYRDIQNGAVAKLYMTNGLPIYREIFTHFLIYLEALPQIWLCNCSTVNFLIYEENLIFFFASV